MGRPFLKVWKPFPLITEDLYLMYCQTHSVNCPILFSFYSGSVEYSRGLINMPQMNIGPDVNNDTSGRGQKFKIQSKRLVRRVALNKPRG